MNFSLQRHNPPGFTLVEIMVAMVIALIVMGGVYQTLVDEDVNHDRSEKILDMQNNARLALERISRDVRRTGSLGCGGALSAPILSNSVTTDTNFISQYTAGPPSWSGGKSILATLTDLAAPVANVNYLSEVMGFNNNAAAGHGLYRTGTDALTLVFLSEERRLTAAMGTTAPTPISVDAQAYAKNDILYITDCENYALFQKTNDTAATVQHTTTAPTLNTSDNLQKDYGLLSAARLFKLNTATYFIHGTNNSLCLNADNSPLASNIEDLQFEFLADEDTDGDLSDETWRTDLTAYTSAKAVRAVRIWVLAMSEPDYTYTDDFDLSGNKRLYVYPNSPYAVNSPAELASAKTPAQLALANPSAGEHRHRYLASAVVYLRNAGL